MTQILYRHREDRIIGGVAGGVAAFLGQDVTVVRVVIAALALFSSGGLLLAYLVAWAMMPEGPPAADGSLGPSYLDQWSGKQRQTPAPSQTAPPAPVVSGHGAPPAGQPGTSPGTSARWLGFAMIAVGVVALLERYLPRFDVWELWPVIIIVIGLATVIGRGRP